MFIQTLNFNKTHKFPKKMIINGKLEENPSFALSVWLRHSGQMWLPHKTLSDILLNKIIIGDHFY